MSNHKKFSLPLFALLVILATLAGILIFSASLKNFVPSQKNSPVACEVANPQVNTGEFDPSALAATWLGEPVTPLTAPLAQEFPSTQVLGESAAEKWIEIDLSLQHLYAHQGDTIIYDTPISSGKFDPTPTGE